MAYEKYGLVIWSAIKKPMCMGDTFNSSIRYKLNKGDINAVLKPLNRQVNK